MLPSYHPSPYIVMPATFGPGKKGPSNLTPNTLILVLTRARTLHQVRGAIEGAGALLLGVMGGGGGEGDSLYGGGAPHPNPDH